MVNMPAERDQLRHWSRRGTLLMALLLLAIGFAVYGNALGNSFVIDDKPAILGDDRVQEHDFAALLTGRWWAQGCDPLYRPLVKITFAANWMWSHEAWAFRLPDLLLHVCVAFVLFLLARDLLRSAWPAAIAAIVFLVHPIQTATLNAIVGRADIMAALFVLLATWLYWRDGAHTPEETSGRRGFVRPVLAALLFGGGLLSKENAATLIGLVVWLDLFYRCPGGGKRHRIWRCYLPLVLVLGGYIALRWYSLGTLARHAADTDFADNIIAHPEVGLGPGDSWLLARWGTPLAVFGKAVALLVWPQPLSWDYSYAAIETVKRASDPGLIWGAACLAAIIAAMVVSSFRRRLVLVAFGMILITYSIVSNTFIVIGTVFAERLLYLPSAGFCLLVGVLVGWAMKQLWPSPADQQDGCHADGCSRRHVLQPAPAAASVVRRALAGACLLAVLAGIGLSAWRTVNRNRDWQSEATLNAADLKTYPRSTRLWSSAATDALNAGDYRTAIERANRSLEIWPTFGNSWSVAGLAHWKLDESDQALALLSRLPQSNNAPHGQANVAMASILRSRGQYGPAIEMLKKLVAAQPRAASARNNLAWYLITADPPELRDPALALEHAKAAISLESGQGDFVDTYISALVALGRIDEARNELRRLLPTIPAADPQRAYLAAKLGGL